MEITASFWWRLHDINNSFVLATSLAEDDLHQHWEDSIGHSEQHLRHLSTAVQAPGVEAQGMAILQTQPPLVTSTTLQRL